jgi:UPF0755 protein
MPRLIRKIAKIISVFIALALVLTILAVAGFMYFNAPPDSAPRPLAGDNTLKIDSDGVLFFEVKSGETALSVGKRLNEAGIIRNRYFWQLLSRYKKDYIKAGSYRIEIPANQLTIHALLVEGNQILVRVTIPEGVTLKKTAYLMEEAGICSADAFIEAASSQSLLSYYHIPNKTFEGYLYPDTYLFPLAYPAEKVVTEMADNFYRRITEAAPEALNMSFGELNNRVILASIVEREYRVDQEAAIMAGVFYNRLEIGMALQSCATVEYVITEIQGRPHPEVLYNRDIEIRDPYNTYVRPGLPPGPISAPGKVALDAVFHPMPSDFLYFRLIDTAAGRHYFSKTLDDHIKAGALYVKGSAR